MNNSILSVNKLKKTYGDKMAVEDISFQVAKGDIVGFLGPNGAGKSTTIRIISGVESEYEGSVCFRGSQVYHKDTQWKKKIGIVPQEIALYEDMSAYENIKFFCSLYGFRGQICKDKVEEALQFVSLWDVRKEKVSGFSGGMKRRLNIACSIVHAPEVLIMDEPTVGIDPQSRNHIMQMIHMLNERGTTVLYVSHYMEEINELCNHILIADHGKIIEDISKKGLMDKYIDDTHKSLGDIFLSLTGTALRDKEEAV